MPRPTIVAVALMARSPWLSGSWQWRSLHIPAEEGLRLLMQPTQRRFLRLDALARATVQILPRRRIDDTGYSSRGVIRCCKVSTLTPSGRDRLSPGLRHRDIICRSQTRAPRDGALRHGERYTAASGTRKRAKLKELIRLLEDDGWQLAREFVEVGAASLQQPDDGFRPGLIRAFVSFGSRKSRERVAKHVRREDRDRDCDAGGHDHLTRAA